MKRLILLFAMTVGLASVTFAQSSEATADSTTQTEITYVDKADDGIEVATPKAKKKRKRSINETFQESFGMGNTSTAVSGGIVIAALAITLSLGMPIAIVFIALYFGYKNKKARYKLAEQALAAGQPIPEGLFKDNLKGNIRSRGIKNIFLGLGLTIFLWALTTEFSIATIGLLIFFTGLGQVVISYTQEKDSRKNDKYEGYANWREIEKDDSIDDSSK